MSSLPITAVRDDLSEVVNRVAYSKERICLTRHGKEVAYLVSVEEAELLDLIEERLDLSDALDALREAREQGSVRWDDFKNELGI